MRDITTSYQRLEKVVVAHLQGLQRALDSAPAQLATSPTTATQQSFVDKSVDISAVSGCGNDENVFNMMRASNVV